jgi:hypothetical protein
MSTLTSHTMYLYTQQAPLANNNPFSSRLCDARDKREWLRSKLRRSRARNTVNWLWRTWKVAERSWRVAPPSRIAIPNNESLNDLYSIVICCAISRLFYNVPWSTRTLYLILYTSRGLSMRFFTILRPSGTGLRLHLLKPLQRAQKNTLVDNLALLHYLHNISSYLEGVYFCYCVI